MKILYGCFLALALLGNADAADRAMPNSLEAPGPSQIEVTFKSVGGSDPWQHSRRFVDDWRAALAGGHSASNIPALLTQPRPTKVEHSATEFLRIIDSGVGRRDGGSKALRKFVTLSFPFGTALEAVVAALRTDPKVQSAGIVPTMSSPNDPLAGSPGSVGNEELIQWGMYRMRMHDTWDWTTGGSIVAVLDNGIETQHADLRAFSASGTYLGGNFSEWMSKDIGENDNNVDELQPRFMAGTGELECATPGIRTAQFAGHGTHVSGIVAATTNNNLGVAGSCPHCSLLIAKPAFLACVRPTQVYQHITFPKAADALLYSMTRGAQVATMSFGTTQHAPGNAYLCAQIPLPEDIQSFCTAKQLAHARDILLIAASGNNNTLIAFPAREPEFVAVGGGMVTPTSTEVEFWTDGSAFSSNYGESTFPDPPETGGVKQELIGPAKNVLSTFHSGQFNNDLCADNQAAAFDDFAGEGYGYCTGTSMAAPHVAALFGLLRSMNPLMPGGSPDTPIPVSAGIRKIVTTTTRRVQLGLPFARNEGFGLPNSHAALREIMGTIGGGIPKNRVTPLFSFYGASAQDHAQTTTPQVAVAWIAAGYNSNGGAAVPGYTVFPSEFQSIPPPLASMYVLSGSWSPVAGVAIVPLWRLNSPTTDNAYATSISKLEAMKALGYDIEKREGYLYAPCSLQHSDSCAPHGTSRVVQLYHSGRQDYAITLATQTAPLISQGYVLQDSLGFGYAVTDADEGEGFGDGIVDGFEQTVGLNPFSQDSDCDNIDDGVEWPLVFAPTGDPNAGPCTPNVDLRFTSSFAGLGIENLSLQHAPFVEVRIAVGSVDGGMLGNPTITGPGTCQLISDTKDGIPLGQHFSWTCQASAAPGSSQQWQVVFGTCTVAAGYRSIELLSSTPVDGNTGNNSATYEGSPCSI